MKHFMSYLKRDLIIPLKLFYDFLQSEDYDSDAVIDDIIEEEQSNIAKYIHQTIPEINTQNYYPLVRKFSYNSMDFPFT